MTIPGINGLQIYHISMAYLDLRASSKNFMIAGPLRSSYTPALARSLTVSTPSLTLSPRDLLFPPLCLVEGAAGICRASFRGTVSTSRSYPFLCLECRCLSYLERLYPVCHFLRKATLNPKTQNYVKVRSTDQDFCTLLATYTTPLNQGTELLFQSSEFVIEEAMDGMIPNWVLARWTASSSAVVSRGLKTQGFTTLK